MSTAADIRIALDLPDEEAIDKLQRALADADYAPPGRHRVLRGYQGSSIHHRRVLRRP